LISVITTNSRKPSSLEETGKECMEAEHKLEMNLVEDEHNQKLLFMKKHNTNRVNNF
jgi:hypothetical protein